MDSSGLIQALQYLLGSTREEVKYAEEILFKARANEGYVSNLLLIACNKEVDKSLRHAAIVNLSAEIKQYWKQSPDHDHAISKVDRDNMKGSILDALINCVHEPLLFKQIEIIILKIAETDFPNDWTNILGDIIQKLSSKQEYEEIYGSLLALKNLFKNYEFLDDKYREPLEEILSKNTFPLLDSFTKTLLSDYKDSAAEAMNVILKTFYSAIHISFPSYFKDEGVLDNWMTYFKLIFDIPLATELESPTTDSKVLESRKKNIQWRNKKWCAKIIDLFIWRYGNKNTEGKANAGLADLFHAKYAIPFLDSSLQTLSKSKSAYVHPKVMYYSLRYFQKALKYDSLISTLKDYLEDIMFDTLIPCLFLNPKDQDDWNDDPIEFIRKENDTVESSANIKGIVKEILDKICNSKKIQKDLLMTFMQYSASVLTNQVDPRTNEKTDIIMKEALLNIVGTLSKPILANSVLRGNMETLLQTYVVPEFKNSIGFLRSRACWLFGIYGGFSYENKSVLGDAIQGIYDCLAKDELPVRYQAAVALDKVINGDEEIINYLKPNLSVILEAYITLIAQIDDDELPLCLERIVSYFQENIQNYALDIINHLVKIFFKINGNDEEEGDKSFEEGEKKLSGVGCLSAISTILKSGLPSETLSKSENLVMPILDLALSSRGEDYIIEGLQILSAITFHSQVISIKIWEYFPRLNYIILGKPDEQTGEDALEWSNEYINEMLPSLQNFIQKGKDIIFQIKDPYYGLTFIELLFKSIEKIFEICYDSSNDLEMAIASGLYITLIENYPNQIDEVINVILGIVILNIPKSKSLVMLKMHLQIVSMCLWYNPYITFGYLQQNGATEELFKLWIDKLSTFKHEFELRRILFGLASILKMKLNDVPEIIAGSLGSLLKEMIKITSEILVLRDKEDSEINIDPDEDYKKMLANIQKDQENDNKRPVFVDKDKFNPNDYNFEDDGDDDDLDDYEALDWINSNSEYVSPLAEICEILYLRDVLLNIQTNQAEFYQPLLSCLSEEEVAILQNNFAKAEQQQAEYEKEKFK